MQNTPEDDPDEPVTRKKVNVLRHPLAFKKAAVRSEDVTAADIDAAAQRFEETQRLAELRRERTNELVQAIRDRDGIEKIRELLQQDIDFNAYDSQGNSLLHTAVECWNTNALILLIEAGMDVHVRNFNGITPLMAACRGYETEACGVILAAADPDLSFHVVDGVHALHIAAFNYKKTRLVEKLLERGVPADIEDEKGRTPLWYALAAKLEAAEVLCMAGGFREKDMAALREAIAMPKMYNTDWDWELLLKHVAMRDPEDLKKSIPKSGPCAPRLPDPSGREVFQKIDHSDGGSFQLQKFANDTAALQARNFDGQTPLMAALGGNISIWATRDLVSGSDATARDDAGRTPLHYAVCLVEQTGIVGRLLPRCGDVDAQDIFGRTPLMMSVAKCGDHIDMLLHCGAAPGLKDKLGLTALDIAKIRKSDYAVKKLQKKKPATKPADVPGLR